MASHPISDENFIMQLLAGLPLEYDVTIANIHVNHTTMAVEEIQSLLLS